MVLSLERWFWPPYLRMFSKLITGSKCKFISFSFIHTYSNVDNKNAVTNNYTIWRDCTKCKHKISNMKRLSKACQHWGREEAGLLFLSLPHPLPLITRDNVQVTGQIQRTTFNNNIGRRSDQISKLINIIEQIKFKLFCKRLKRDTLLDIIGQTIPVFDSTLLGTIFKIRKYD